MHHRARPRPVSLCPLLHRAPIVYRDMQGNPQDGLSRVPRISGPAATRSGPAEHHVLDYLAAIYRHRYLAAGVFLTVVVAAAVRAYTTTPLYRAQARVMIEIEDDQTTALAGVLPGENVRDPEPYYQTQFRILTGRELGRRTVASLGLEREPEFADAAHDPAALVSAFMARVSAEPIKSSRLVDVGFVSADARAGGAGGEPTGPRLRGSERGGAPRQPDQQHHLARSGARSAAAPGRGVRARHGHLPRAPERAVAPGQPEHRGGAAQLAQRRGHPRAHHAGAEGVAVRPGEGTGSPATPPIRSRRFSKTASSSQSRPTWPTWNASAPTCRSATASGIRKSSR